MTPREFFYPRVAMDLYQSMTTQGDQSPTTIHFNIDRRQGIFPLQHLVQRQCAILDALFRISEGLYFGPHHLIMATLLYFEEKVHMKKLQRADTIPLLFSRLLCHILEHVGYPTKPHLERHYHCREHFTLDQWTQLAGKNL